MGSPIPRSDHRRPRVLARLGSVLPALQTFGYVALMLGLFLLTLTLLIAWIRTPEAYFVSTDPRLPHVVRGGDSVRTLLPWLRSELSGAAALIAFGLLCLWGLAPIGRPRTAG